MGPLVQYNECGGIRNNTYGVFVITVDDETATTVAWPYVNGQIVEKSVAFSGISRA